MAFTVTTTTEVSDEEEFVFEAMNEFPTLYFHCDQVRLLLLERGLEKKTNWVRVRLVTLTDKGLLERIGKKGSYLYRINKNNIRKKKRV